MVIDDSENHYVGIYSYVDFEHNWTAGDKEDISEQYNEHEDETIANRCVGRTRNVGKPRAKSENENDIGVSTYRWMKPNLWTASIANRISAI